MASFHTMVEVRARAAVAESVDVTT